LIDDDESKRIRSLDSKSSNTKNTEKPKEAAYKTWETNKKKKVRHRNELSDSSNNKKQANIF
jgi:hypothetical protein